jgi:hypothetical protein
MKKKLLLTLCILGLVFAHSVLAEPKEKGKPAATYEVKITITYNAVLGQEAAEIAKQALVDHGERACQVGVKIKKGGDTQLIDITNPPQYLWVQDELTTLQAR